MFNCFSMLKSADLCCFFPGSVPTLRLLVVSTGVPRITKTLVANVRRRKEKVSHSSLWDVLSCIELGKMCNNVLEYTDNRAPRHKFPHVFLLGADYRSPVNLPSYTFIPPYNA